MTGLACSGAFSTRVLAEGQDDTKDLVQTAIASGQFRTLVQAIETAGLAKTLAGPGPFTVLAPTDEAFAKLPEAALRQLLKSESKLTSVLMYHVVAGNVTASDIAKLNSVPTLGGQRVGISVADGTVKVDNANLLKADIAAGNGVIHVIDRVLMPSMDDIVETAHKTDTFRTLLAAAKAVELVDVLKGMQPLTVFAPSDEAFAKLPDGVVEDLLKPKNRTRLTSILKYHVIRGRVFSEDLVTAQHATTLLGEAVRIRLVNGRLMVNDSSVSATDIDAANGVIHVIDRVLMPSQSIDDRMGGIAPLEYIAFAIERGVPRFNEGDAAGCTAIYEVAAQGLLAMSKDRMPDSARNELIKALDRAQADTDDRARAWTLRRGLDQAADVLSKSEAQKQKSKAPALSVGSVAQPPMRSAARSEANEPAVVRVVGGSDRGVEFVDGVYRIDDCRITTPLPEGYPAPTPPGAIEIKRYPLVRRAQFSGSMTPDLGMNLAFFPLFNHIKQRQIAMTSPVEMNYEGMGRNGNAKPSKWTMSFLYRNTDLGPAGVDPKDKRISIEDIPPTTVLSIGMKGSYELDQVNKGLSELRDWLSSQSEWEEAADPRALYYNGPEVASDAKWSEVQIPVRRR